MEKSTKQTFHPYHYASVNLAFIKKHLRLFPEDADVRLSSGITMRQMVQLYGDSVCGRKN